MYISHSILPLLLLLTSSTLSFAKRSTDPKKPPKNAILLSSVSSLTFHSGRKTTGRRLSPIPQLSCTSSSDICALYQPSVVRCTNEGSSYGGKEDVEWACRADLPDEFKLGATDVICEGYESAEDPYVLKGSCALEYKLLLTEKGERRFGNNLGNEYDRDSRRKGREDAPSAIAKVIFLAIFGGVLFVIIKSFVDSCRRNPPRLGNRGQNPRPPWFGGGGGGGDDNNDDPPPPYDSHRYDSPRNKKPSNTGSSAAGSSRGGAQAQQGWRPGPWTAGLAGAAAGYMAGRNQTQPRRETQQRMGGGLFGGGGGNTQAGPSLWNSGGGSSSPPSFGTRHESTGFGGTRRR